MDRRIPDEIVAKRRRKYVISAVAVVFIVIASMVGLSVLFSPRIDGARIAVSVAESGNIESSVTASGTVIPQYELAVTSPVETNIISIFHIAGEILKKGDQLIRLNKEFLQIAYEKLNDELELKKNKKLQKQLNLKNNRVERLTE